MATPIKQFKSRQRTKIKNAFKAAHGAGCSAAEAESFVTQLEILKHEVAEGLTIGPPALKARRRNANALATALERSSRYMYEMDIETWVFANNYVGADYEGFAPWTQTLPDLKVFCEPEKNKRASELSDMAARMQRTANELGETLWKVEDMAAKALRIFFCELDLPFETKDEGLAADCLRAVLNDLRLWGGKNGVDRPAHRLQKAASDEDTTNEINGLKKRLQKQGKK